MTTEINISLIEKLYQLSSLIGSKRFLRVFNQNTSLFSNDLSSLFVKLRKDLSFQLIQVISYDYKRGFRENGGDVYAMPADLLLKQTSLILKACAEQFVPALKIAASKRKFVVNRQDDLFSAVYTNFNYSNSIMLIKHLSELDTPCTTYRTHDARQAIAAIGVFIESLNTLSNRTGNSEFDTMLDELMSNVDYFVNGYPHDVLAYDADAIRRKKEVLSIQLRKDYCSSWLINASNINEITLGDDSRRIPINLT